jgi:hypothetical protein
MKDAVIVRIVNDMICAQTVKRAYVNYVISRVEYVQNIIVRNVLHVIVSQSYLMKLQKCISFIKKCLILKECRLKNERYRKLVIWKELK